MFRELTNIELKVCHWQADIRRVSKLDGSVDKVIQELLFAKNNNKYPYTVLSHPIKKNNENIYLDPFEVQVFWTLGPMRTAAARSGNYVNMRRDKKENEEFIERNGITAEFLYGKIFNLYPYEQLTIEGRTIAEDKGDYIHNNFVVDIKATHYKSGRLTLATWKVVPNYCNKIHYLCLFTGDIREKTNSIWKFIGYQTSNFVTKKTNLKKLRSDSDYQYIVDQYNLFPNLPIS